MPLETTLQRIEAELAQGDYGKARDRLHGLLVTYPQNLALRRRLAEIYHLLHQPAMAGRYWYLEADQSPEMAAARAAFQRSCGEDPLQILQALKFRGDPTALEGPARQTLAELQAQVADRYGMELDFRARGRRRYRLTSRQERRSRLLLAGCVASLVAGLALMMIGLAWVIDKIF
jgi:predicted Zn-dependent protease